MVTSRQPTETEWHDLAFAWTVVPFVLSNGVVIARHAQTVGIGGGQPNRVDAVRLALWRAGERARQAVLASDAFSRFRTVSNSLPLPASPRSFSLEAPSVIAKSSKLRSGRGSPWCSPGSVTSGTNADGVR